MPWRAGTMHLSVAFESFDEGLAHPMQVEMINTQDISALFHQWNYALQTRDPKQVVELYETNAILIPTVSNQVRYKREEIEDYFVGFLAKGPAGELEASNIRVYGDIAIHSGVYIFTFSDNANVPARFTFVYRWNGQRWLIIEHHSSQMPETTS